MLIDLLIEASYVLQILASIATIFTAIYAGPGKKDSPDIPMSEEAKFPLGHKEIFPALKWILLGLFLLYIVATLLLIYYSTVSQQIVITTLVTFVIMILGLLVVYVKGRNSLKTRRILAPKHLWQVMSNRIPSYLEECDGPFCIKIIKVGCWDKDEHEDNDQQSGECINNLIEKKIALIKKEKEGQTFLNKGLNLYNIEITNNPFYHRSDTDKAHGLIVFIGDRMPESIVRSKIDSLAEKFPDTPIGYYSFGTYPSPGYYPPYINLRSLREEDYIDHLIFRYYSRSHAWKVLADFYHKSLITVSLILAVFLVAIPAGKLHRMVTERNKLVMSAPDTEHKGVFTKLVNYLFVVPSPKDVKIWKTDTLSSNINNIYRYSENGGFSHPNDEKSLIAQVIKNEVFLLYNPSQKSPYTVWRRDGVKLEGRYDSKTQTHYVFNGSVLQEYKWMPRKQGDTSYDDRKIRLMYSYGEGKAVEVIYSPEQEDAVKKASQENPSFLLDVQRFLILYNAFEKDANDSTHLASTKQRMLILLKEIEELLQNENSRAE